MGRIFRFQVVFLIFLVGTAVVSAEPLRAESPQPQSLLVGMLILSPSSPPSLKTQDGQIRLRGAEDYLAATLADPRLAGRRLRLEGRMEKDGAFRVRRLYTVRDGRLFKVRFYCGVCHIHDVEPGPCMCCQGPTEFREIPTTATMK